jgi:hypothetical protein
MGILILPDMPRWPLPMPQTSGEPRDSPETCPEAPGSRTRDPSPSSGADSSANPDTDTPAGSATRAG